MTSKISFSKMCKENMKRNLAVIFCTVFIYLMELLAFVISLQNVFANKYQGKELIEMIQGTVTPRFAYHVIAMIIGLYLAYQGFGYLHDKMQTDFYASLPTKRSTNYKMILRNTLIIFIVPLILTSVCKLIILAAIGQMSGEIVLLVLKSVGYQFLAAASVWVLAVLAIVLTGNVLVGGLGWGVLAIYMPGLIKNLIPAYSAMFFQTYVSNYRGESGQIFTYFSPISLVYGLTSDEKPGSYIIGILIWIIVIGILGYVLYLKRPAEAAGRAMAFEKANPVFRFLIVIPMALYSGLFLSEMSLQSSRIWLVVGILVGAILFHGIMEAIYQFDVHGLFSHKKQLLLTLMICYGFTAVFLFDLTGFDRWSPKKEKVASVEVSLDNMTFDDGAYWGEKPDGLSGKAIDVALELMDNAVIEENEKNLEEGSYVTANMTFHMKNGSVKYRKYMIDEKKSEEAIAKVFEETDFKNDYFSLYTSARSKIKKIEWDNTIEYQTLPFSKEEQDEFLDIYLGELSQMTYDELKANYPCGEFVVTTGRVFCPKQNGYRSKLEDTYYVYPTFKKTIAYLNDHGITTKQFGDYDISKIEVERLNDDFETEETNVITNRDVIEKYRDELVYTDLSGFYNGYRGSSKINVAVTLLTPEKYTIYADVSDETGEKMLSE